MGEQHPAVRFGEIVERPICSLPVTRGEATLASNGVVENAVHRR